MNGVMMPVVSAGSNHDGASETCTAHVSCPAGGSERAGVATTIPRSTTRMVRISRSRDINRSGTRSVMRILLCVAKLFGAKPRDRETEIRKCARLSADGRGCQRVEVAGDEPPAFRREWRLVGATSVHHVRAARVEATARRRIERARNLAAQD